MFNRLAVQYGGTNSVPSLKRRWIRRQKPTGLLGEGLTALLAIVALTVYAMWPFAQTDIEARVRSATRAALNARGYAWVQIAVTGQDIELTGMQPTAGAGDSALSVARSASCETWAGRLGCAGNVSAHFSGPIGSRATPINAVPHAGVSEAAACEKSFNDILGRSQIEFSNASAMISARSEPVLDALAKAAGSCDDLIRIEAYTDSSGAAEFNVALSAARANSIAAALVKRGLPKSRLKAVGFGAEQPIADNSTAYGRAKNRRIEFRVVQKEIESTRDQS